MRGAYDVVQRSGRVALGSNALTVLQVCATLEACFARYAALDARHPGRGRVSEVLLALKPLGPLEYGL